MIDGPNLYVYLQNSPLNDLDPWGLCGGFWSGFWNVVGKVWTLLNTVIGFGLGIVGIPFGAVPSIGNNAIQFTNNPAMNIINAVNSLFGGPGISAITFGNVINYAPGFAAKGTLALHEQAHTYQYQAWGPFFLPAYLLTWGIPFEQAANAAAQGG